MLFLLPRKRNKLLCSCGVFISLSTNSRRLINTPLDSKSLYVNFLKQRKLKGKGNSITPSLVTFGSKAFKKENACATKLQEAPFGFLVPTSNLSSQFSGRRARGLTSQCVFWWGRKEERKLSRKQRRNVLEETGHLCVGTL